LRIQLPAPNSAVHPKSICVVSLQWINKRNGYESAPIVRVLSWTLDPAACWIDPIKRHAKRTAHLQRYALDRPYISGPSKAWVKLKSSGWKRDNQERFLLFEGRGR
jgi:hypothetical protein